MFTVEKYVPLIGWTQIKECETKEEAYDYIEEEGTKGVNYRVIIIVASTELQIKEREHKGAGPGEQDSIDVDKT